MSIYHCGKLIAGKGEDGENDIEYLSQSEYEDKRRSGTLDPKKYYATPQDEEREKCVSYIIQREHGENEDGTTWWYVLYNDGWCEQGGRYTTKTAEHSSTINLKKSYLDTSYYISITPSGPNSGSNGVCGKQYVSTTTNEKKTKNSFVIASCIAVDSVLYHYNAYDWKTEGFVS